MRNYETFYKNEKEPWKYSQRAIEILRHNNLANRVKINFEKVSEKSLLELGCSKGALSEKLLPLTQRFAAVEISGNALEEAKKRLNATNHFGAIEFQQGSVLQLPFEDQSFQIVIAADGIHEWDLSREEKQKVYSEIHRVLKPEGIAIFSDYLKPTWFVDVLNEFKKTKFQLVEVEYFGDRPSYQSESLLKAFQDTAWVKKIVANQSLANRLQVFGKWLGPSGSRHMIWVGKKREN